MPEAHAFKGALVRCDPVTNEIDGGQVVRYVAPRGRSRQRAKLGSGRRGVPEPAKSSA